MNLSYTNWLLLKGFAAKMGYSKIEHSLCRSDITLSIF